MCDLIYISSGIDSVKEGLMWLALTLDKMVYSIIGYAYQIFLLISRGTIFTQNQISVIFDRLYLLIGVIMLFVLVFSLMQALANPDNLTKGDKSATKIVQNTIITIIMLVLIPWAFKTAYSVQDAILESSVLGRIILGTNIDSQSTTLKNSGFNMSADVLFSFFEESDASATYTVSGKNGSFSGTFKQIEDLIKQDQSFSYISDLDSVVSNSNNTLKYSCFVSTVAGIFCLYIMISFCIDLGLRAVKLAFYQIVAPIPIIARLIPGKSEIFKNWSKSTINTFIEVLIKVSIIYFAIYLIGLVPDALENIFTQYQNGTVSFGVKSFATVFIIMGILMFAKQAPKLLGDLFGGSIGSTGIGIKKKLAEGGVLSAAAAIGAGVGGFGRNAVNAFKNGKENVSNASGLRKVGTGVGSIFRGIGSTLAGGVSATRRGYKAGSSAKDWKDTKNAMNTGADEAALAREDRAGYKASHGGTVYGALTGHTRDKADEVGTFLGGGSVSELMAKSNKYKGITVNPDKMKDLATSSDAVINLEKAREIELDKIKADFAAGKTSWTDSSGSGALDLSEKIATVNEKYDKSVGTAKTANMETVLQDKTDKNFSQMSAALSSSLQDIGKNMKLVQDLAVDKKITMKDASGVKRDLTAKDIQTIQSELTNCTRDDGTLDVAKLNSKNLQIADGEINLDATTALSAIQTISKAASNESASLATEANQKQSDKKE